MPMIRPKNKKAKAKRAVIARLPVRPVKPVPKCGRRRSPNEPGELAGIRAEAEAAIAEARKSHERLREAIDILPEGIVFLDAEGRYILWNKKYAEIYSRSADLIEPGAPHAHTHRQRRLRNHHPE
jgi:PAS domain-containing protein